MSNEAQQLLNHIQYKTGKSLSVIAKEIGYSRPHLNKAKTEGIEGGKIVGILKTKYAKELEDVPSGTGPKTQQNQDASGVVPASEMIAILKEQNEFLRRNFETSLITILVGQKQIGAQIKGLTWYHASAVNKGDQDGIEKDLLETNNMIAAYQGAGVEGDNSETGNTKSIGGKRQSKR